MKVLIVSPYFPPHQSVAVVRVSSLTRYLLKKDHDVSVLTNELPVEEKSYETNDILTNIKKVKVDISQNKGRYFKNKNSYIKAFRQVMDNDNFDVVLITAGPYYTIPLCKISKQEYNTKCVIDYRDLWLFDIRQVKDFIKPGNLLKKITFFPIEFQAMKYADKIITVTNGWAEILKRFYPLYKRKITTIYNGYDDNYIEDTNKIDYKEQKDSSFNKEFFNVIVFGKLSYYSKDYARKFLETLRNIQKKYPRVRLVQIGTEEAETKDIMEEIKFPLKSYINTGFLNYNQGLALLKEANVTILIDIRKKAIGTKIYDYIYVNKPLLYIGPNNTYLSNFVSDFDGGFSCQTASDIEKNLATIIESNINFLTSNDIYMEFSRSTQNKKYYELLKLICFARHSK